MPNFYVFNDDSNPLYSCAMGQNPSGDWQIFKINGNNVLITSTQAEAYCRQGLLFGVTSGAQPVAQSDFLVMQLTNPIGSGKSLHLSRIIGGATVNTTIDLLRNASFTYAGTAIAPVNRNFSSTATSIATAKYYIQGTDPTTGGVLASSLIETGGAIEIEYNGSWILSPGNTLVVRVVNNANQNNPLTAGISWWEETP